MRMKARCLKKHHTSYDVSCESDDVFYGNESACDNASYGIVFFPFCIP